MFLINARGHSVFLIFCFRVEAEAKCPLERAVQQDARGQAAHIGFRGKQTPAPRSMSVWLN